MEYLADTVAIIRHFSKKGKIGKNAKQILLDADEERNIITISIISIIEIMYLAERHKIPIDLETIKEKVESSANYQIIDIDIDIVNVAKKISGLELHDRLIVATAKYLGLPILTSDAEIMSSKQIECIGG